MTDRSRRKNGPPPVPCGNPHTGAATQAGSATHTTHRAAPVGPRERWELRMPWCDDYLLWQARRMDRSDAVLVQRLRRMVQP